MLITLVLSAFHADFYSKFGFFPLLVQLLILGSEVSDDVVLRDGLCEMETSETEWEGDIDLSVKLILSQLKNIKKGFVLFQ